MALERRKRAQLIAALLIAPLVIVLPSLWSSLGRPGFVLKNADVLLIFVVLPYGAALWLALAGARRRRSSSFVDRSRDGS